MTEFERSSQQRAELPISRREMLGRSGMGFGLLGLTSVLAADGMLATAAEPAGRLGPLAPKLPHFAPKAKQVVHLFMNGGPSHVDTFDRKLALDKWHGKPVANSLRTERKTGAAMRSPFKFQRYGKSGIEVSELFAHTAECIDDIAVIRSMHADVPNHEPSLMLMNCGDSRLSRPSMGSWNLRPRLRESEPPWLRGDVSWRLPDCGDAELALRVSTGR